MPSTTGFEASDWRSRCCIVVEGIGVGSRRSAGRRCAGDHGGATDPCSSAARCRRSGSRARPPIGGERDDVRELRGRPGARRSRRPPGTRSGRDASSTRIVLLPSGGATAARSGPAEVVELEPRRPPRPQRSGRGSRDRPRDRATANPRRRSRSRRRTSPPSRRRRRASGPSAAASRPRATPRPPARAAARRRRCGAAWSEADPRRSSCRCSRVGIECARQLAERILPEDTLDALATRCPDTHEVRAAREVEGDRSVGVHDLGCERGWRSTTAAGATAPARIAFGTPTSGRRRVASRWCFAAAASSASPAASSPIATIGPTVCACSAGDRPRPRPADRRTGKHQHGEIELVARELHRCVPTQRDRRAPSLARA